MNQTHQLIKTLKRYLKARGITYRQLGERLQLSEASVKRLFSQQTFTLKRLEAICTQLDLSFYDLAKMPRTETIHLLERLSMEQEQALVNNTKLMLLFYLLLSGWSLDAMMQNYEFSEEEVTRLLLELDKLQLIELYPDNQYKMRISRNFSWRKEGPIWKAFKSQVQEEFLNASFDGQQERLVFYTGELSPSSLQVVNRKIDLLLKEFNELAEMDSMLCTQERTAFGFVIGMRPWVFSILATLQRRHLQKEEEGTDQEVN